jgi:GR25 family glycosyltransferase involved in LPS biosynthesis
MDRIVCITSGGSRRAAAAAHFAERGVEAVLYYRAVQAEPVGITTTLAMPEWMDPDGQGTMGPKPTGCWLAHRAAWAAAAMIDGSWPSGHRAPDTLFVEDDVVFPASWRELLAQAVAVLPDDWSVLYVGSCGTLGRPTKHVRGYVFEVQWPQCLHAYLVRSAALPRLMAALDAARARMPIDVALAADVWPTFGGIYTIQPALCSQRDTVIPP